MVIINQFALIDDPCSMPFIIVIKIAIDQIYYKTNLIHLKALKSTTKVLLLSNHQQIMMMIVGTGLVCGALPFQILDLRNAASKCVEIFSEWLFLISHSFSFKITSMKL